MVEGMYIKFRLSPDATLSIIKIISTALIIALPLRYISYPEESLISVTVEHPIAISLGGIGFGLIFILKFFECADYKGEDKFMSTFLKEIVTTFGISLCLLFFIYIFGAILAILFFLYFVIFLLMITFGIRKFFNYD